MTSRGLTALGLFSGCGGLDYGAERAGFDVVSAFDTDADSVETYNRNLVGTAVVCDVSAISSQELPRHVDLLLGGPPCQGFSSAGAKRKYDPRNELWRGYLSVLAQLRPKAFVLENVRGFLSRALPDFLRGLEDLVGDSYHVEGKLVNTQFYGVPQRRVRAFVLGYRRDVIDCVRWPEPDGPEFAALRRSAPYLISISKALEDLGPAMPAKSRSQAPVGLDHIYAPLEDKHESISRHVPNGGALKDIPESSLPMIYQGRERGRIRNGMLPGWLYYYRRPDPSLPGRTVLANIGPTYSEILAPDVWIEKENGEYTWQPVDASKHTDGRGLYTSPVKQRRLSVRECARLQTFPDSFEFSGNLLSRYRQIGNAVPCEFSRRLCETVWRYLVDGEKTGKEQPS